jgi:hypothetical protein
LPSAARLALALAAALSPACVSFDGLPAEGGRAALAALAKRPGSVRIDARYEQFVNGRSSPPREGWGEDYVEPVFDAYRSAGVFDRVADSREPPAYVADVRVFHLLDGGGGWKWASYLTLFLVPSSQRAAVEIVTVVRAAGSPAPIGVSSVCKDLREVRSLFVLPVAAASSIEKVKYETIYALAGGGLALALGSRGEAPGDACPSRLPRPRAADARGSFRAEEQRREQGECLERPAVRSYVDALRARVAHTWVPAEGVPNELPVPVSVQLAADGGLTGLRVAQPGEPKRDERTLSAVRSAAPFGALDGPLQCLREQAVRIDLGVGPT